MFRSVSNVRDPLTSEAYYSLTVQKMTLRGLILLTSTHNSSFLKSIANSRILKTSDENSFRITIILRENYELGLIRFLLNIALFPPVIEIYLMKCSPKSPGCSTCQPNRVVLRNLILPRRNPFNDSHYLILL